MPRIEVVRERCKGCDLCALYCPRGCVGQEHGVNKKGIHPAVFSDSDKKCTGCSFCAIICPDVCITVYK